MLRRELLSGQFGADEQGFDPTDPESMQQLKDMLADLNALLAAHARQEDTTDRFADFMDKHGDFFPEQPETVEELIDALARREAAAQRLMNSLSPQQREQLSQLLSQAMADADLAFELSQLSDNLRALRPGLDRESGAGMRPGGAAARLRRGGRCHRRPRRSGGPCRPSSARDIRARPSTTSTSNCSSGTWADRPPQTCRDSASWSRSSSDRAS